MSKTIYDLELHECIYIDGEDCYVTRVASGWIYKYFTENMNSGAYYDTLNKIVFVPFDNTFQEVPNTTHGEDWNDEDWDELAYGSAGKKVYHLNSDAETKPNDVITLNGIKYKRIDE
jgi:hypothetical protein